MYLQRKLSHLLMFSCCSVHLLISLSFTPYTAFSSLHIPCAMASPYSCSDWYHKHNTDVSTHILCSCPLSSEAGTRRLLQPLTQTNRMWVDSGQRRNSLPDLLTWSHAPGYIPWTTPGKWRRLCLVDLDRAESTTSEGRFQLDSDPNLKKEESTHWFWHFHRDGQGIYGPGERFAECPD